VTEKTRFPDQEAFIGDFKARMSGLVDFMKDYWPFERDYWERKLKG
jgi:hypothetical protein